MHWLGAPHATQTANAERPRAGILPPCRESLLDFDPLL